jgi:pyrroloquinoline quinone biosynthesis protein B
VDRRRFLAALAAGAVVPRRALEAPAWLQLGAWTSGTEGRGGSAGEIYALVLGSVQDAGLPQVGCYTERCDDGRALHAAGRGRYVSSLALVEPEAERFYLVDATPDITRQIDLIVEPGFRLRAGERRPFDGIFLTHAHIGHYTGLAVLGNEGLGVRDTPVYCTRAMAEFLSSHRDELADTVGFVFRGPTATMLFLPDINSWALWERDVAEAVASVDVALLDGSFWSADEVPGRAVEDIPHPLIPWTMDALQGVVDRGAARVVLTHLNNSNPALDEDGPQQAEIRRRGFDLAREGMRFEL